MRVGPLIGPESNQAFTSKWAFNSRLVSGREYKWNANKKTEFCPELFLKGHLLRTYVYP